VRPEGIAVRVVAEIVKQYALAAGLDPTEFSGHSLRAGFVTSAAESGAAVLKIQEVSRHRSMDVLAGYVARILRELTRRDRQPARPARPNRHLGK